MLQPFLSHTALICLSTTLAFLSVGCSPDNQTTGSQQQKVPVGNLAVQPNAKPTLPPASPKPEPEPKPEPKYEPSPLELALDKATGALNISKSAQSPDDWNLVASQFQDAIALMKKVQRQSPNFPFAQSQISEYQRQINYAQQRANPPKEPPTAKPKRIVVVVPQPATIPKSTRSVSPPVQRKLPQPDPVFSSTEVLTQENEVFTAPIKRRISGTPIVEVTFNGQQRFEMIVDTGASGTVITQKMAIALGVVPVGKAKANTASSRAVEFSVGYVNSMEVGGVMTNKVPVAIAGVELETGLLGHDFFGNYDVTIKRNSVEFRRQNPANFNPAETQLTVPTLPKEYRFVRFP